MHFITTTIIIIIHTNTTYYTHINIYTRTHTHNTHIYTTHYTQYNTILLLYDVNSNQKFIKIRTGYVLVDDDDDDDDTEQHNVRRGTTHGVLHTLSYGGARRYSMLRRENIEFPQRRRHIPPPTPPRGKGVPRPRRERVRLPVGGVGDRARPRDDVHCFRIDSVLDRPAAWRAAPQARCFGIVRGSNGEAQVPRHRRAAIRPGARPVLGQFDRRPLLRRWRSLHFSSSSYRYRSATVLYPGTGYCTVYTVPVSFNTVNIVN